MSHLGDGVAGADRAWLDDLGVQPPETELIADTDIDEPQRLSAIARRKFGAPVVRLIGDLDDRLTDGQSGSRRQVVVADVEVDVQLVTRQRTILVEITGRDPSGNRQ